MIDNLIIRQASIEDIDFIVDTIVAAEKSGTDNLGLAKLFCLSEDELRNCIKAMLNEEIEGCEFSISSYIVAEVDTIVVAAFAGWIEGKNENDLPSAILKSNLVGYCLPAKNVKASQNKADVVRPLQIDREAGTYQLEYSYTIPEFRGKGIIGKILDAHEQKASIEGIKKIQVHVFDNNASAISSYQNNGFVIVNRYESTHPETRLFFPSNTELLMEKYLTTNI